MVTVLAACGELKSAPAPSDDSGAPDAEPPGDAADANASDGGADDADVDAGSVNLVFVTTAQVAGDFGGSTDDPQKSADAVCQGEANAVGNLRGTFVAWLSYQQGTGTAHNARDRLPNVAYYLPGDRLEGGAPIMIAASLGDLLANGPLVPLDHLANGTLVPADENPSVAWVWTGTQGDGTVDPQTCSSWSSASSTMSGITGNARQLPTPTPTDWTTLDGRTCDVKRRFYCFQQ